ncbi:PREDICTED: sulfotransferase 1 family member D1-like isoform X2 [Dinoponera quadriceps]|uniref:Sulfotransferase 1 family member D1-like isoform X2 n=1 Tax=Dinoponera quadriceps TaxID=609295 RepID=A0A6P3XSI2_DINQU|nr:PREDICTED: sulfotransferase 1 family member D1-like isoform X2 [Dinoponera quadriceps]
MSFKNLKFEIFKDEKTAEAIKHYPYCLRGLVGVGEKKWCLPHKFLTLGEEVYNFEPRPDDTYVITFPRSGTTLTQELIWLVANDMNFDEAGRTSLLDRFPFLDISVIIEDEALEKTPMKNEQKMNDSVKFVQERPSPRFIKSHMPFELLPKVVNSDCKIIYVARNPKDVVVSWYYFQKEIEVVKYNGNFEQFCDGFMNDRTLYSPYWEHVKEGWANRHRPNILFLFYEDLIKDLPGCIRKVGVFFEKNYDDEQITKLVDHLGIKKFRENKMVNFPSGGAKMNTSMFIRKGVVDGWREDFTPEIEIKFNKWVADNMKDTDLIFPC